MKHYNWISLTVVVDVFESFYTNMQLLSKVRMARRFYRGLFCSVITAVLVVNLSARSSFLLAVFGHIDYFNCSGGGVHVLSYDSRFLPFIIVSTPCKTSSSIHKCGQNNGSMKQEKNLL